MFRIINPNLLTFYQIDDTNGNFGVGIKPTAALTILAGSATAGNSPLKFTSGPLLTASEAGAFEFLTDQLYFSQTGASALRRPMDYNDNPLPFRIFS